MFNFKKRREEKEALRVFDALVEQIRKMPKPTVTMLDMGRYAMMMRTAERLRRAVGDENIIKIETEIDQTFLLGSITMELTELTVTSPRLLIAALFAVDTFEVYPLTNGNIRLGVTFRSVLKPIA